MNTGETQDQISIQCAGAFDARWRAEVALLGLLCPAPSFRWGTIGGEFGIDIEDFSSDDTNLIARSLCVGSSHGRDVCANLAALLLLHANLWDVEDERDFVTSLRWGPGPLAALFIRSSNLFNERELIARMLGRVRRLPPIPKM